VGATFGILFLREDMGSVDQDLASPKNPSGELFTGMAKGLR
jgi:hypothetical protein